MDFNFGNNNEPEKPEENNNIPFSFNPENNAADTDDSVADDNSPFDATAEEVSNDLVSDADIFEEQSEGATEDDGQMDVFDAVDNGEFVADADNENYFEEDAGEMVSQEDAPAVPEEAPFIPEDAPAVPEEAPFIPEETPAVPEEAPDVPEEEAPAVPEEAPDVPEEEAPAVSPVWDRRVRTPDGEQEYLLSELIDVETGEPLDLSSLIPQDILTSDAASAATEGFGMGVAAAQPAAGGFDMSAGSESAAPSKRRRPARPKASSKKGGFSIVGVIFGGLLAFALFPYVMALIEMTTGAKSNIPIPAPGIKSTYKYIPKWWPDWAMFMFPGRTADDANNAADEAASPKADNAAPDANKNGNDDTQQDASADNGDVSNDAESKDLGDIGPDPFGGNDVAEDNNDPIAEVSAEPGVVNAPQYTSADVSEAVAAVGTAFKAAKKIDDSVYAALNDMAEKSTFVDTSAVDDQLKDAMGKVRVAMGNFGTKAALASALSEKWAARVEDASDNAGVMLVGTLTDVAQRDGYQINTITVLGQDGSVEVVGLRKIKPAVGDKVVVCGKRIADPGKNLGGFTDNGKPVVWGGIVIKAENK